MKKGYYFLGLITVLLLQFIVVSNHIVVNKQQNNCTEIATIETHKNALDLVSFEAFSISSTGFETCGSNVIPQLTVLKNNVTSLYVIGCNELFLSSLFNQYSFEATNQLIRYRKKDLIFPFHNFT